jgi:hypothetical protein
VGKSILSFRRDQEEEEQTSKRFAFVQTFDTKPKRRLFESSIRRRGRRRIIREWALHRQDGIFGTDSGWASAHCWRRSMTPERTRFKYNRCSICLPYDPEKQWDYADISRLDASWRVKYLLPSSHIGLNSLRRANFCVAPNLLLVRGLHSEFDKYKVCHIDRHQLMKAEKKLRIHAAERSNRLCQLEFA